VLLGCRLKPFFQFSECTPLKLKIVFFCFEGIKFELIFVVFFPATGLLFVVLSSSKAPEEKLQSK